jgi:predicted MFS family arabinose efflux permease
MGLFSRNLEEGRESFLWGLHSTVTELAWAGAAALGGFLAQSFGFGSLFLTAGVIAIAGSLILLAVYKEIVEAG